MNFGAGYEDGLYHYYNKSWNKINNSTLGFEHRNIVTALCYDNQNNLWAGSFYGSISKYNGVNAENFNSKNSELTSGAVNQIRLDQKGNIWVCLSSGLYKYAEGWQSFNTSNSLISGQSLEIFSDSKQNVWLTNQGVLYAYNKEAVQKFDPSNSKFKNVGSMVFDKENKMWIGDHEGLSMYNGEKWYRFDTLATILLKRDKEIFETYKDTNWVKENYKDYLLEDEIHEDTSEAKRNYNFSIDAIYLDYWSIGCYVTNLFVDNQQALWFYTSDAIMSFNGNNWFLYDTANSPIPSTNISAIVGDNENNIWISTWDKGLFKFDRKNWIIYDTTNSALVNNRITILKQLDDLLFIGTDSGMMTFDGSNWKEFDPPKNKIKHSYCMIKDQKGNYWIGSSDGLFKYDGKKWKIFNTSNSGIADNFITSLSIDYAGNLWIVSANRYLSIFNESGIKDGNKLSSFIKP